MFAVGADGVNFWEEVAKCGREVHRELDSPGVSNRNGMSVATFGEQLDWIAPKHGRVASRGPQTCVLSRRGS